MAVFFAVRGAFEAVAIIDDLVAARLASGFDRARLFAQDAVVAIVLVGAALVLWRSAERLAAAIPGTGEGVPIGTRNAAVAFALLGTFFLVEGVTTLASLTQWFDRARFIILILFLSVGQVVAAAILWRRADRLASATVGREDEQFYLRQIATVGAMLIGTWFTVRGILALMTWLATQGAGAIRFSPRPTLLGLIPVVIRLGLGVLLMLGARALGMRMAPVNHAVSGPPPS